jgi:hypothetical protein
MLQNFVNTFFGCSHKRTTFPITPAKKPGLHAAPSANRNGMYVVCLDCGREFGYDWDEMRLGSPVRAQIATAQVQASYR